jgi:alcohol dehydrogenase class IV
MFDPTRKYSYSFPTNIRFGAGVAEEIPGHLKGKGLKHPLIVTDPVVAQLPFFQQIVKQLEAAGLATTTFMDVQKNPVKSDVLKGDDAYKAAGCDSIIGLGGGVALDVARAIALRVNNRRDLFDYDDLTDGWQYVDGEIPYFVTVPTNAGTGSEVGRSTVISEDNTHKKRLLFAPQLLARQIFADPLLTMDLPPLVTASTGMDALAHNLEAFLSKGFHPMAEGIALEGIRLIGENLEKAVTKPDLSSRAHMLIASLMGAVAFQKGLGIVHALAHPLSTVVDAHHGTAIALMFSYGIRFNTPAMPEKMAKVGAALGIKQQDEFAVAAYLYELREKMGLPGKLREIGVQESHLDTLTALSLSDFCLPSNERPADAAAIRGLYEAAL